MIVHDCVSFNNYPKYPKKINNKRSMETKHPSPQTTKTTSSPAFSALLGVQYLNRFDPEKSASAYNLMKCFHKSYAINDFAKTYDIAVAFSTDWLKKHPNFPYKYTGDFFASITTMFIMAKKLRPDDEQQKGIKYYYIGMYGNDSLTGSEENLAHYLTKMTYWNDIRCNLFDTPTLQILEPLERKFYE